MELDRFQEARDEIAALPREAQFHPDILKLRWRIALADANTEECVEIAQAMADISPGVSGHWFLLATSLAHAGRANEAYVRLKNILDRFPYDAPLRVHLATICTMLGREDEGKAWLAAAEVIVKRRTDETAS